MTEQDFKTILDTKIGEFVKTSSATVDAKIDQYAKKVSSEIDGKIEKQIKATASPIYKTIEEVPTWGREVIQKYVNLGVLTGTGVGVGDSKILNITNDLLRILVIIDRLGLDKNLSSAAKTASKEAQSK
jgi:hypothetical protein